jgi:serine/threonine protein kinase
VTEGCLQTEVLAEFFDGRADIRVRMQIEDHASRCAQCRNVLSAFARSGTPPLLRPPPPLDDRTLPPGTQVDRYVIVREIGAGGMGVVFSARDPELDRMVAVKVLRGDSDPLVQERLRREAQAMAQLAHPNGEAPGEALATVKNASPGPAQIWRAVTGEVRLCSAVYSANFVSPGSLNASPISFAIARGLNEQYNQYSCM